MRKTLMSFLSWKSLQIIRNTYKHIKVRSWIIKAFILCYTIPGNMFFVMTHWRNLYLIRSQENTEWARHLAAISPAADKKHVRGSWVGLKLPNDIIRSEDADDDGSWLATTLLVNSTKKTFAGNNATQVLSRVMYERQTFYKYIVVYIWMFEFAMSKKWSSNSYPRTDHQW